MNKQLKRLLIRLLEQGDKKAWEEMFAIKQEVIGAINVLYKNLPDKDREDIEEEVCEVNAWLEYGEDLVYDAEKYYEETVKSKN